MGWATLSAAANRVAFNRLGSVAVVAGAISGQGFLQQNGELALGGEVMLIDYLLDAEAAVFGGLAYGDPITVGGEAFKVEHKPLPVGDGMNCRIPLVKV